MTDKRKIHKYVVDYLLEHPCVDCGEKDIRVLEFDHLHSKKFGISTAIHQSYKLRDIKAEIAKCEVRCSNCHLKKTHKDQNSYKHKAWLNGGREESD